MSTANTDRRNVLKAIATGVAGSAIVGSAGARTQSVTDQLERVKNATESFTDVRRAMQNGFRVLGPPQRRMGWLFINLENVGQAFEGNFDITKPQILTYSDDLELGAVFYIAPRTTEPPTTEPPDLFADEGVDMKVSEEDGWGRHGAADHVFANTNGKFDEKTMSQWNNGELVFGSPDSPFMDVTNWVEFHPPRQPEPGTTVDGYFQHHTMLEERTADVVFSHPDLFALLAWVHTENPEGVFNPANPSISIEGGVGPGY